MKLLHKYRAILASLLVSVFAAGMLSFSPATALADGSISFKLTDFTGLVTEDQTEDPATLLLLAILQIFVVIAIPIIALFIIYAGFLYVTAQGNPQQIQQAHRALTYAVIGAVLIIGAVAIAEVVGDTVNEFRS